jgi:hypothetical protein
MSHLTADGGFIYQARANAKQCKAMLSNGVVSPFLDDATEKVSVPE